MWSREGRGEEQSPKDLRGASSSCVIDFRYRLQVGGSISCNEPVVDGLVSPEVAIRCCRFLDFKLLSQLGTSIGPLWVRFRAPDGWAPSHPGSPSAHASPALVVRAQGGLTLGPHRGELAADI